LLEELPTYRTAVANQHHQHRSFIWVHHRTQFPNWGKLADIAFLAQPSSCAAERVYSQLKHILLHENMLTDGIRAALMARCNQERIFKEYESDGDKDGDNAVGDIDDSEDSDSDDTHREAEIIPVDSGSSSDSE
jgi:hypothetical protein